MKYSFGRAAFAGLTVALPMLLVLGAFPPRASGQETSTPQERGEEIVANLAAGRVVIAVVKDAIVVGTLENPIEAETQPPAPVEIGTDRVCIILGPVDWFSPSSHRDLARLNQDLPHLRSRLVASTPHLGQSEGGDQATDIETIGRGLLERLNQIAQSLHGKVNLPDGEPLAQLIIADYQGGYGPEVWQLSYSIKQEPQNDNYWDTRILGPVYLQFWPPEKGQSRTLVEFNYPPENAPTSLLNLLRQKDPRLEKIRASDSQMARVADQFLQGESGKIRSSDAIQFLRAALSVIAPPKARETMAIIGQETGFAWILPPPAESQPQSAGQPNQQGQGERPAGAPSLFKH